MPIPGYETLMLPLLQYVAGSERRVRDTVDFLGNRYALTEEERNQLIPSGRTRLLNNRVHWAGTYLVQAGVLRRPRRGCLEITNRGQQILAEKPDRIDNAYLSRFPEFNEFKKRSRSVKAGSEHEPIIVDVDLVPTGTPEEQIAAAYEEMNTALRQDLLSRIVASTPTFFERLIIDLMLAMGYGGSHTEAARHLGTVGDGGIDGVIDGDPLGLDAVYLQAKKYTPGNSTVGRPEVQAFVGSLVGRGAQKGVFITASSFAQTARQYAGAVPPKVILIDGDQLTTLMIRYGVAVRTSRTVDLKRVDLDYFGLGQDE